MDSWSDLCRCCLSANTEVSLLDAEQNVAQRFLEITTIEVKEDDGLPQKICAECYSSMNMAYEFRTQCLKMEIDLKTQLRNILSQCEESIINNLENAEEPNVDNEISDDSKKRLETVIKKEPMDSDDDYYYLVVVNDAKEKGENEQEANNDFVNTGNIKSEVDECEVTGKEIISENESEDNYTVEIKEVNNVSETPDMVLGNCTVNDQIQSCHFDKTMDSFLITNSIPSKVPATILENEEVEQFQETENEMQVDDTQDSMSQEAQTMHMDENTHEDVQQASDENVQEITDQNLIKILTAAGEDGTILLNSDAVVQYITDDGEVIMKSTDGEQSQEVILCEGDESQFRLVDYDGSELVIQYTDEGNIATVLQQDDDTYLCECGDQFQDLQEFQTHQHKHNPGNEFLCNMCGKGFESAEILTGHMHLHNNPDAQLDCPFCQQSLKRSALTQHIKYSHSSIRPQCDVCNKSFANPNNLKRHMMIHTGVKEFACDMCPKRFHQKITMQTHKLTHANSLSCPHCDLSFKDKETLEQHKVDGVCPKNRAREEIMKTVKQEITTNFGKVLGFACSLCKKMFSMEDALEKHIELMHIVDPAELLCSECGEVVNSKAEIQAHMLSHDKRNKCTKRFECSTCGKGCSSQAMLLMHERVHTNERPYACQLCPLKFKTKTHLRTHQLTHTREKKFGCSVCMKFFALKGNLVVHLRTHTGERPYACPMCDESFIDSKYLKKHKLKKHPVNSLEWK